MGTHPGVILLVDDSDDDVYLTRHAFEQNDISNEIVVARGIEAPALLLPADGRAPLVPAIVLLDINMPRGVHLVADFCQPQVQQAAVVGVFVDEQHRGHTTAPGLVLSQVGAVFSTTSAIGASRAAPLSPRPPRVAQLAGSMPRSTAVRPASQSAAAGETFDWFLALPGRDR